MTQPPTTSIGAAARRQRRRRTRSLVIAGIIAGFAAPAAVTAAGTSPDATATVASGTCGEWSTGDPTEPCGPGQQITFAPGTSSFLFDGGIYDTTQVWYFQADGEQALDLNLQSADDNIDAVLFAPDGTQLLPDDYVDGLFETTLPADGLYALVLSATDGGPYGLGLGVDNPDPLPMGSYGRIAFEPGTDEGVVQGSLAADTFDTWLFNADAGQVATVGLASTSGSATFTVLDNTGEPLAADVADWEGELPAEGFYTVIVSSPGSTADYDLTLAIPDGMPDTDTLPKELFFAPGTDSGSINGELAAGGWASWVLWAAAGQTATLVSTGDPVTVEVWSPSGEALAIAGDSNAEAIAELPENGLYTVFVYANPDAAANYSVDITIPELDGGSGSPVPGDDDDGDDGDSGESGDTGSSRISFPPGGNTATIEASLPAESWHTYTLAASADQELYAYVESVDGGSVGMELYAPDGTELFESGDEGSAVLPEDGDYRLVVGTAGAEAAFVLDVAIY